MKYVKISADGDLTKIMNAATLVYLTSTQDDTAVVLRAQLTAEECAALWVAKLTAAPGDLGRIGFAQKLSIAQHLGLPHDLAVPMKTLNRMRNDMAHELGRDTIVPADLINLKRQVEAITLPAGSMVLENPIRRGMPRDGTALLYDANETTSRQRLSIIFDAFLIRFFLVWQATCLKAGKTLAV